VGFVKSVAENREENMGEMNRTRGVQMVMAFFILICPALVVGEEWGFRPDRAEWLEFGGEMRMDFIVPEEVESYVYLDRVEIDIKAIITEGVYSKGILLFASPEPKKFELDIPMWYTRLSLGANWLKLGLTDRFIAPKDMDLGSRKTAGYPLSGVSFWRDEQYNVTLGGLFHGLLGEDIRYRLSYGSGLKLSDRRTGDHKFDYTEGVRDEIFHDDDHGQHGDEIGAGLGFRHHFYPEASLDLVGFGIWSRMTDEDDKGDDLTLYPDHNDQQRLGGRIVFAAEMPVAFGEAEPLLMAEYIVAKDGKLDRNSWYVQASCEFSFARPLIAGRFLTEIEPLIRYGKYTVDAEKKEFTDPLTWDRTQLTGALLIDLVKNVGLRIEYDMNTETTGNGEIANNELRVQLRTRW